MALILDIKTKVKENQNQTDDKNHTYICSNYMYMDERTQDWWDTVTIMFKHMHIFISIKYAFDASYKMEYMYSILSVIRKIIYDYIKRNEEHLTLESINNELIYFILEDHIQ